MDRDVAKLRGGELQRFAIAIVAVQDADIYMFDEPSSYLDVKQRLKASRVIRSLLAINKYIIVVEHDLSVLDYLSDFICCLYGKPGAYGVVTMPFGVREGINIFLAGFVPTENLRFRPEELTFKVSENEDERLAHVNDEAFSMYEYPSMVKTQGGFTLSVDGYSYMLNASSFTCANRSSSFSDTLNVNSSGLNLKFSVGTKPAKKMLIPSLTPNGMVTTPYAPGFPYKQQMKSDK
jgi:translation initiation factor RLI1